MFRKAQQGSEKRRGVRRAAVAGAFYSGVRADLESEVDDCFAHPLGPGARPPLAVPGTRSIRGAVVPHAGLMYSGPTAAHAYGALAKDGFPPTFIIIGPNHRGYGGPVSVCPDTFETPLGTVPIATDIADELVRRGEGLIAADAPAQAEEHSIEVQLPFLQRIGREFSFVPIAMTDQEITTSVRLGKLVAEVVRGKEVVLLASTDFSHYIPDKDAKERDRFALDAIVAMDPKRLWTTIRDRDITMCGYGPTMAVMTAVKELGAREAQFLKYSTSGDVSAMEDVVGYGALLFR